jgi:hypothetical protein
MERKVLLNQLELAYAPLTAYEFANLKTDEKIEQALEFASLYIIGQRPVITFENITPDFDNFQLIFEIHQKENPNILECKLPLDQKYICLKNEDNIGIAFNFLDKSYKERNLPLKNIHGFSLLKIKDHLEEFIIWFSPEKLLQNWWKGYIECEIVGDFTSFTKYKVHYVGKATKQSIFKRLTGHSTFQDILSLESTVTEKQLPANEIVILPFEFQENLQMQTFGDGANTKDMVSALLGETYPKREKVFLDAEKAIIKAMQPTYNKELFDKYPISKDGLFKDKYDAISYTFIDPISLVYEDGEINGGLSTIGGDTILILKNKEFKLIKFD